MTSILALVETGLVLYGASDAGYEVTIRRLLCSMETGDHAEDSLCCEYILQPLWATRARLASHTQVYASQKYIVMMIIDCQYWLPFPSSIRDRRRPMWQYSEKPPIRVRRLLYTPLKSIVCRAVPEKGAGEESKERASMARLIRATWGGKKNGENFSPRTPKKVALS